MSEVWHTVEFLYDILLHHLQHVFGIQGTTLSWFKLYLTDRQQIVSVNGRQSKSFQLLYGVPQGSVLGPILFILYTQQLTHVIKWHSLHHQLYADDTQLYKSCFSSEIQSTVRDIENCATDIKSWMKCYKLQLNDDKTGNGDIFKSIVKIPSNAMLNSYKW